MWRMHERAERDRLPQVLASVCVHFLAYCLRITLECNSDLA